jgi:hypothetical protein
MKTIKLSFILIAAAFSTLSCEKESKPVQEVERTNDVTDCIVYGDYDDYSPYNNTDKAFYKLQTRYRDCRITDCGTYEYIDKIMPARRKEVVALQREYDSLRNKTASDYKKLKEKTE